MLNLKEINKTDYLKRNVDNGLDNMKGCTPFDPPEAYDEERKLEVDKAHLPLILQHLMEEHEHALDIINRFEKGLIEYKTQNYIMNPSINAVFHEFFKYYDNSLMLHNEKEDKVLFPILERKLMESGEHSIGENPTTAIDVMEDDHVKFIQLGSIAFNFFGLTSRIRDEESKNFVCEAAYNASRELIELLKLHIYREDHTLFPLATKLISHEEFTEMEEKVRKYKIIETSRNHQC